MQTESAFSQAHMAETWHRFDVRDHVVSMHEACGVIVAVATGPEVFLPTDWLPLLTSRGDPGWAESSAADEASSCAMGYWNHVDDLIRSERPVEFPDGCRLDGDGPSAELDAFAEGFLRGQEWLESAWEATGERDHEPLDLLIDFTQAALVYLCGHEAIRAEMRREHPRFPENPEELMELLPQVFSELGRVGREFAEAREKGGEEASF